MSDEPRFIVRNSTPKTFEVYDRERDRCVWIPPTFIATGNGQKRQLRVRDQQRADDWARELNATAAEIRSRTNERTA